MSVDMMGNSWENEITLPPALAGEHSKEILETLGLGQDEVNRLISSGSVAWKS